MVRQSEPCERCPKLLERPCTRHGVPLLEHPAFLDLGKLQRQVLAVPHHDEWAVVGLAELEPSSGHASVGAHADLVRPGAHGAIRVAVAIICGLSRAVERLDVEVRDVGPIAGVRPGQLLVETEVGKRQPHERDAPEPPAFIAPEMAFIELVLTEELAVWRRRSTWRRQPRFSMALPPTRSILLLCLHCPTLSIRPVKARTPRPTRAGAGDAGAAPARANSRIA